MSVQDDTADIVEDCLAQVSVLSPDEIAHMLEVEDIKGVPSSTASCPLARYLDRQVVEDGLPTGQVWVGEELCGVVAWVTNPFTTFRLRLSVPSTVQEFVYAFDSGCYPQLEVEL